MNKFTREYFEQQIEIQEEVVRINGNILKHFNKNAKNCESKEDLLQNINIFIDAISTNAKNNIAIWSKELKDES